ncbi:hypothetical protein GCM10027280_42210 [Micromonospora polyrhachis]|uniref:Uncharacterized protein n=1 Tax=Micromonospora polyrhachis TaxID=1282883 RepID=A0A7W7SLP8_9ACTN|nr:hypothetical protein [Micromonospora polyrhachis]MBB4957085.1 hypothetical protein [Micromonospora polyrhachis]
MSRMLRIELRRSVALGAALILLITGAIACYAAPGRWSSNWMALAMIEREYLVLLFPLALAVGAWQGRRESRNGLAELVGSTPRPRPQRVLPIVGALGIAVTVGYLAVLAVTAPWIAGTARYLPAAAFAVVAVGILAVVAAAWLGLAVGRLWPSVAAGPVLAVAGIGWLMGFPGIASGHDWLVVLFSPMYGMNQFSDYETVSGRLSAAQAVWLGALAVSAYVLHTAKSRRTRVAALLPVALGVAVAIAVMPHDGYLPHPIDPVAKELVCTTDAPKVCVARVHSTLLPEVTPPARQALALLAKLPQPPAEAHEDTTTWGPEMPEPRPDPAGIALMTIQVDRRGHLASPNDLVPQIVARVLSNPGGRCPDGLSASVLRAATYWLVGTEPPAEPGFDDGGEWNNQVRRLWQGLRELPEAEALARVAAVREGALNCADLDEIVSGK